jgi:hypothetical protein
MLALGRVVAHLDKFWALTAEDRSSVFAENVFDFHILINASSMGKDSINPGHEGPCKWHVGKGTTLLLFRQPSEHSALGAVERSVIVHREDSFVAFTNERHGFAALFIGAGS